MKKDVKKFMIQIIERGHKIGLKKMIYPLKIADVFSVVFERALEDQRNAFMDYFPFAVYEGALAKGATPTGFRNSLNVALSTMKTARLPFDTAAIRITGMDITPVMSSFKTKRGHVGGKVFPGLTANIARAMVSPDDGETVLPLITRVGWAQSTGKSSRLDRLANAVRPFTDSLKENLGLSFIFKSQIAPIQLLGLLDLLLSFKNPSRSLLHQVATSIDTIVFWPTIFNLAAEKATFKEPGYGPTLSRGEHIVLYAFHQEKK